MASFPYSAVSIIDLAENKIIKTFWAGVKPFLVAFNPDASRVYVTDYATASVKVIDTATNVLIDTIDVGNVPIGIAIGYRDVDVDGIADDEDSCVVSDLSETVVIEDCDSGVNNDLATNGCTIKDDINACIEKAKNHGGFVSCVAHLTKHLNQDGVISKSESSSIKRCTAISSLPHND